MKAIEACPDCQGTGWVLKDRDSVPVVAACPSCRTKARIARLLEEANIPPRYRDRGFEVYSIHHPLQEKALKRSMDFVDGFPTSERGLLFIGPCGVGKTHLSVATLKTLIEEKGVVGKFVDETELLRRLQYSYNPDTPETEREVLLPLMEAELVVWDDLGRGRPTEWVQETIRTVINHRYTYKKHTIFTTNRPLSKEGKAVWDSSTGRTSEDNTALAERIGRHLYSRIMEMCEVIEVKGPDARTEIHKARMDFLQEERAPSDPDVFSSVVVPEALLRCPHCKAARVDKLDSSATKGSRKNPYVELFCRCQECSSQFLARFFLKSARLEYPELDS